MGKYDKNDDPIFGRRQVYTLSGELCYRFTPLVLFRLARITFERFDNGEYQFAIEPHYDVIDGLIDIRYPGIPGIDLDRRNDRYYRVNRLPQFISERTPQPTNKRELQKILKEADMKWFNWLEWLMQERHVKASDPLIIVRIDYDNPAKSEWDKRPSPLNALKVLGFRKTLKVMGHRISEGDRAEAIRAFMIEYMAKKCAHNTIKLNNEDSLRGYFEEQ